MLGSSSLDLVHVLILLTLFDLFFPYGQDFKQNKWPLFSVAGAFLHKKFAWCSFKC